MGADRYVALLRGVNVGGKNKLPMKDLAALVVGAGASDVATYIQSGNVILTATATVAKKLPTDLAQAIESKFGISTPVVIRSAKELASVLARNPYPPEDSHVAFLAGAPTKDAIAKLDPTRSPGDAFTVDGAEVFLHLPNGVARTKLTNAWFDSRLGTVSTLRNWKTVVTLAGMVGG